MLRPLFFRYRAKKLFFQALKLAKKQQTYFSKETKALVKTKLEAFQDQIVKNHPPLTQKSLREFASFKKEHLDLKGIKKWVHFTYTTLIALGAALVIRQMWFELYKVPTGSMRPTIKELDHLTVSKLNFSLNVPFTPKHLYFDPELVKRSSICVFTSENMDVADSDTLYFYLIPGKKLLVKRLIAKPGDLIYFHGGKLYGLDKDDNDITAELNPDNIALIDHIPFIQWLGEKELSFSQDKGILYHMNAPYATFDTSGNWSLAVPKDRQAPLMHASTFSSAWGLDNFAATRLLNAQTKKALYPYDTTTSPKGLFLEFKHHLHPIKSNSSPLKLETSLLPLDDMLAKKLFSLLYTARFEVQNGTLRRYGSTLPFSSKALPKLHHIPDGTYEFYYGKAYKVLFGGLLKALGPEHPLYRFSPTALELFFNLGIEFNNYFIPGAYEGWAPPRYSYYRDGALYVMGLPFLEANDEALKSFSLQEAQKHYPFISSPSPLNADGTIDKKIIKALGLRIPDKMYFVLGDNHAQSADSRVFGFVPQENLKGCPDLIFWPFGSRFGHLPQAAQILLTLPRSIVWSIAWIITIIWLRYKRKRERLPLTITLDS